MKDDEIKTIYCYESETGKSLVDSPVSHIILTFY